MSKVTPGYLITGLPADVKEKCLECRSRKAKVVEMIISLIRMNIDIGERSVQKHSHARHVFGMAGTVYTCQRSTVAP